MKAGIFYGTRKIGIETLEKPVPGPADAVIRVIRAGICGSEVYAYRDNDRLTCVKQKGDHGATGEFGHEFYGIVDSVGESVRSVAVGDLVFVNPATARRGGLAAGMGGGFSEYMIVEDAAYGYNLMKWSENVDPSIAALLEPLCVATRGKNQAGVKAGDHVVILGGGAVGLCALSACLNTGCQAPVVIDRHAEKLEAARRIGGVGFDSALDGDLSAFLQEHFGTGHTFFGMPVPKIDAVIDCAGAPALLDQMIHLAPEGMRIAIVAGYAQPIPTDLSYISAMEIRICGSRAYRQSDVEEAFENINSGRTDLSPVITHHFKLDDLAEAFRTADDKKSGAIKIIIDIAQ